MNNITFFYSDFGSPICTTQTINKNRKTLSDFGDIPGFNFNTITNKPERIENLRGRAYSKRNQKRYWKNKRSI